MEKEEYSFGTLEIGCHVIVGKLNEGLDAQLDVAVKIIEIARKRFNGEPWAYISNRVNSYSVQPIAYKKAAKIKHNMVAFAVVTNTPSSLVSARFEEKFATSEYKFDCFETVQDAVSWVTAILDDEN